MINSGDTDLQKYLFHNLNNDDLFKVLAGETLYIHANGLSCTVTKDGLLKATDRTFVARQNMITGHSFNNEAVKRSSGLASRIALPGHSPQELLEASAKADTVEKDEAKRLADLEDNAKPSNPDAVSDSAKDNAGFTYS